MNHTKIEWCDFTVNPIKGLCKYACSYCYARRMYKRFHWDEEVRLDMNQLDKIAKIKTPSKIFVCSTHDLFGDWIPDSWIFKIITELHRYPQHTFLLLTKNPQRYKNFSFRDNFWLGQTVLSKEIFVYLPDFKNIKFISFEPLLNENIGDYYYKGINWFIIGGLTPKPKHTIKAVESILLQADRFGVPVFIKDNTHYPKERKEFPQLELFR